MKQKRHPCPQQTISVVSPETPFPDFHELSPFDVWESRFPVVVQYVYPAGQGPIVSSLTEALARLLLKYPSLGGRFELKDSKHVLVRYSEPEITVIVGPEELDDMEAWQGGTFKELLVASVSCGMPICTGTSLFEARITPIMGGRTLVSVCVNHGLVDMQSLAQFMADWGRLARGVDVDLQQCEHHNSKLILSEAVPFDQETVHNMGWQDSPFLPWIATMGLETLIGESVSRAFRFTPEDVAALKALVMQGVAWPTFEEKGYRLSAHDVLTALLWKSLAQVHPYHPEEEWDLVVVVNWRGRSETVPADYFGNATTSPHMSVSMEEILHDMDFSQCALCVRELSTLSTDGLEQIVAFQNHLQYGDSQNMGLDKFVNVEAPMISNGCGLYISNFCKFDLYDVDFGAGRPELVRFQQPPIPGMCFAYPEESGKDVTLVVSMSRWDSSRLVRLDCAQGQAVVTEQPPERKRPFCQHNILHQCHNIGKSIRKVGRVSRGGEENGRSRPGDFTRGVIKLASSGHGSNPSPPHQEDDTSGG
mmetsp:Transcript_86115/g.251974  ORF Transcript_86115/g.251974 Transcript_86115/m.251974 type:complete len:534 (+) Transcript_86115:27-1628(+)